MPTVVRNWPEPQGYLARNAQYLALSEGYVPQAFPRALADYVDLVGFPGRVFNENHYAGYLIWRWVPEDRRLFSDSRFDIFGSHMLVDELEVYGAGNLGPLDRWEVDWVIAKSGTVAGEALAADGGWALVADWTARPDLSAIPFQVWVRRSSAPPELVPRARRIFESMAGVTVPWNP
jgi:hypothetical protein